MEIDMNRTFYCTYTDKSHQSYLSAENIKKLLEKVKAA